MKKWLVRIGIKVFVNYLRYTAQYECQFFVPKILSKAGK